MSKRSTEITNIISKLKSLREDTQYQSAHYAIDENIKFFKATLNIFSYVHWLLSSTEHIEGKRLLELTDFPIREWDIKMHTRLIQIERNEHIGLGRPLVDKILQYINQQQRPLVLANLGAGGMEVDRQIILKLLEIGYVYPVIFIGVDKSPVTQEIAFNNISSIGSAVDVLKIDQLTNVQLDDIRRNNHGVTVILCKNDIFELDKEFSLNFDLAYHSLLKHHLSEKQHQNLDVVMRKIAKNKYEYDGYRAWRVIVPQTVVGWNYPVFLEATVFSNLRYKTKIEIEKSITKDDSIEFYKNTGNYFLEFK